MGCHVDASLPVGLYLSLRLYHDRRRIRTNKFVVVPYMTERQLGGKCCVFPAYSITTRQ